MAATEVSHVTEGECRRLISVHRRVPVLDWKKVRRARRRLAAGHYERHDVLDAVLDAVIADLAEPQNADALQAVEVSKAP